MKSAVLILASVAAFDLGVMAVAAHAHPGMQTPPGRSDDFVNQGLINNTNNKLGTKKDSTQDLDNRVDQGSTTRTTVWDPNGTGGCTPGSPVGGGTSKPCLPGAMANGADGKLAKLEHKEKKVEYRKLDKVNTLRACTARGGTVIPHMGAQHCRISLTGAQAIGNPLRNPRDLLPKK